MKNSTDKMRVLFRSSLFILFLSFAFVSCDKGKAPTFTLTGTLKGAENKKVMLETMRFPNINQYPKYTLIDTVRADADGNFKISDVLPERTICRLSVEGVGYNYYILSLHDETLEIHADMNEQSVPEIKGSTATSVLYAYINEIRTLNITQLALSDSMTYYMKEGNDSMVAVYRSRRINGEQNYKMIVRQFVDTTSELSNAIIGLEGLAFSEDFDFIKNFRNKAASGKDSATAYFLELNAKVQMHEQMTEASFIGKPAKDIEQPDPTGKMLKLSDLKGKVVLLDFWASWCGPCRKENPNVVKAYKEYKDRGFEIYSVSLDTDRDAWLRAIEKDGLIWKTHVSVLRDTDNKAALDYRITGIPMSFLIDKDGVIVAENLRGAALEAQLAQLLPE